MARPAGEVSLWADAAAGDANSACAEAEVNTRLASLANQAHQASGDQPRALANGVLQAQPKGRFFEKEPRPHRANSSAWTSDGMLCEVDDAPQQRGKLGAE